MQDYVRRFLIAGIMAVCVALLFLGVKNVQAETPPLNGQNHEWMWPSEGVITDSFGTRNGEHKGIDIAASVGSPVYAVDRGTVTKSYYSDTYGHVVFVKHENGMETVYAHLQERMVGEGGKVQQGEIIGKMGSTGDSSGVHLHFEVHQNEWTFDKKNAVNPMTALGYVEIGQAVAAARQGQNEMSIETSARLHVQEEKSISGQASQHQAKADMKEYIVQKGETLWSIAKRHGMTVADIQEQNKLKNEDISAGQRLYIPATHNEVYIVQSGDTLNSIARKYGTSVAQLISLNEIKDSLIKPGQKLLLDK